MSNRTDGCRYGLRRPFGELAAAAYLCGKPGLPMILYNLTLKTEWSCQSALLRFLEDFFRDHTVAGGYELFTLLGTDTTDGPTYCMHLQFPDMGTYNGHMMVIDAKLKQELHRSFGDKVVYFGSVLEKL